MAPVEADQDRATWLSPAVAVKFVGAAGTTTVACTCTALLLEQIKQQHHVKLTFYRLHMDSGKGDWHLFNEEDVRMLREIQDKIDNGQYSKTKIEWQSRLVDEGLPE